ncbi:MAG: hypothetical protein J1E95_00180 [Muribaculaceae bacterium]|nr:hypothetical protein [Muribaculaceae bacterium]
MLHLFFSFLLSLIPYSSFNSEEEYIIYLQQTLQSPGIDEVTKVRAEFLLEGALKNRPGSPAADFSFTDRNGKTSSLYREIEALPVPCLLIFYDPDCNHCNEVIEEIIQNAEIDSLVSNDLLKIIAVYSGDEFSLWQKSSLRLPGKWCVGYEDGSLQDDERYLIIESPSIYLLKPDKTVWIKEMKDIKELKKLWKEF